MPTCMFANVIQTPSCTKEMVAQNKRVRGSDCAAVSERESSLSALVSLKKMAH